jgi:hypothetical protein
MHAMRDTLRYYSVILTVFALAAVTVPAAAPGAGTKDDPAIMDIRVDPDSATAGQQVQVTVQLTPRSGFKLNKYPQISLKVPEIEGVVAGSSGSVGSKTPPPPEEMDNNYFKKVDPLVLSLDLDPDLKAGRYEIAGKLKYFYCVKASGYCAPMKLDVSIPVTVN